MFLIFNYFYTKNSIPYNHIIDLDPLKLCKHYADKIQHCTKSNCYYDLEQCISQTNHVNRVCQLYLSEFYSKYILNKTSKINEELNDLLMCIQTYKHILINRTNIFNYIING